MKKQFSFYRNLLLLAAFILLLIGSCKKSIEHQETNETLHRKSGGSIPTFTTVDEVNEHFKWIARGFANWPKPMNLIRLIDSVTNIFSNDSNENSINYLNTLYNFGSAHNDSIDTRFPGNDYDSDGLTAFQPDGSSHTLYTKIMIPNTVYTDITKPFVVVPVLIRNDSISEDTLTGYFAKFGGGIDSVPITDANEEDYYIWYIDWYDPIDTLENEHGIDSLNFKIGKVQSCNGDGYCDNWEFYEPYCPPCTPNVDLYKVVITSMEIGTDQLPRAERFTAGKYDFAVSYGLEDGLGNSSTKGRVNDFYYSEIIKRLKKKEVCRAKSGGGTKSHFSGTCPTRVWNLYYLLYDSINITSIARMPIIFHEMDNAWPGSAKKTFYPSYYSVSHSNDLGNFNGMPYLSYQSAYGSEEIDLYAMKYELDLNGLSYRYVGNSEAKIRIELIKL